MSFAPKIPAGKGDGGGDTAVAALVKSIVKHKNFRQLASYSVKCLQKVITPPNMGWESNMKEAYEAGALDAIAMVLKKHAGDEEVLTAATACLSSLATNPAYAGQLVESGAMVEMMNSVTANPTAESGLTETLELMEVVSTNNPEALLKFGGVTAVKQMLEATKPHPVVFSAAMRTLEKINKVPGGAAEVVKQGALPIVLESTSMEFDEEADHLEPAFRLLDRMCRIPEHAEAVRDADGMRVLSAALDKHKALTKVCKVGGRLLTKLASGNVGELIKQLEGASSPSEKEFLSQLLANLALEEDNAEKIVQKGGVGTLVKTFVDASQKTIEGSARALARIAASSDENCDLLVEAGAVVTLVNTITSNASNPAIAAAVAPTLLKLATSEANVAAITAAGGVETMMGVLRDHPEFEEHTLEALRFFENLGTVDYDMQKLVDIDGIAIIVKAMLALPENRLVQLNGARTLIYMSDTEENVGKVVAASGQTAMLNNLARSADKRDKAVVLACMYMLTTIALVPANKAALASSGGVDTVLGCIADYANDEDVTEAAREVVEVAVDQAAVKEVVGQIQSALTALLAKRNKTNADALIKAVGKAGAFSIVQANAEHMVRSEGVRSLVSALQGVATADKIPGLENILRACSTTLMQVSDSVAKNEELRTLLGNSGAVQAVIASVKQHPKLIDNVTSGVAFLESYARIPSCARVISEEGGVEACSCAMLANATDIGVIQSAVNTLLQLAATDKGAVAVARHGGTRQIISTVEANVNTPHFAKPMEAMLTLLQRVAMTSEGAQVLIKQGGVDAVIDAADSLADNARVAQGSSRVLAKLLTKDDVTHALERLTELSESVEKGRIPAAEDLKPIVSRVGHMSLVGNNAGMIVEGGGAKALVGIIGKLVAHEDPDIKAAALPIAVQALSNLAVRAELDPALGAAALLAQSVSDGFAVAECIGCIETLAKNESNARTICSGPCVEAIVTVLKSNMRMTDMASTCFGALASLASHASTVDAIAGTAAVRLVQDWLDDNIDDADPTALENAVRLMAALAASPTHAKTMLDNGVLELVKGTLTKACIDSDQPAQLVLAESLKLIQGLGNSAPDSFKQLSDSGTLKRVTRAVSSNPQYIKSGKCMMSCIQLLHDAGADREVAEQLIAQGADEMIVAAMNANGTNQDMLVLGAKAMTALGCGAEAGLMALDDVKALCAAMEGKAEVDEAMVLELGDAVSRLSNLMMVEGIVNADSAPEMMVVLNDALARLADSEMASPETLAAGVQSIGRLASMEVTIDDAAIGSAVEMVMDVLQMNEDSDIIRESAIHCIGNMASGAAAIKVMSEQGCMAVITEAAKSSAADEQLQTIVAATLKKITSTAEAAAAELVKGEDGAEALASVIEANAQDVELLASCVESIVAVEGGEDALWEVLDNDTGNQDMSAEMLRVLHTRNVATGSGAKTAATPKKVQGLMKSMASAMAQQAESTAAASDSREQLQHVAIVENSLSLLSSMELDVESCDALAESGIADIVQLLGDETTESATPAQVMRLLNTVTATSTASHKSLVANKAAITSVVTALKANSANPSMLADAVQVLNAISSSQGAEAIGLDRDAMRAIQAVMADNPSDAAIQAAGASLVAQLGAVFSDEPAKMMKASLDSSFAVIEAAAAIQEVTDAEGRVYYVNSTTNETMWEAPAEMVALQTKLTDMAMVASQQAEDNITDVAADKLEAVVKVMENNAGSATLAKHAADTLNTLSINETNCDAIARCGGVRAILAAVRKNPHNPELLKVLLVLLEKISRNDFFKEQIASEGGIQTVIDVCNAQVAVEAIAIKCLSTLANLAFNSAANIERIMKAQGVKACELAMQTYPNSPRLLENAMCTLSNLMYGSDENKLVIGQTCGDEIVHIIRVHNADNNLFKMALRALGNLAYCDENIEFVVVKHNATKCIVDGMQKHADDTESLQLAIEVLGNFASLEEEEDVDVTVASVMYAEGGTRQIITVMQNPVVDTGILKSGMDALSNVANDVETTELMAINEGVVQLLVRIMQSHDWDADLMEHAVPLLTTLTYSTECSQRIASMEGMQVILNAMETHGDNRELLHSAQAALTNLASMPAARTALANIDGTQAILRLLSKHLAEKPFALEVMGTLTRLCGDDTLSMQIAEEGMHGIMGAVTKYANDPDFLTHAFRLLGHLAFVEANLQTIVQHDGIQHIIRAICTHPDDKTLMVRSIQTIDNIAMANKEHAQIVIEEGGRELIEQIMDSYGADEEITRHGKSAVLSMSALENLSKTTDIGAAAGAGSGGGGASSKLPGPPSGAPPPPPPPPADPLAQYRNFLSAGSVINLWTKGAPKPVHVLVSPDWRSIVWQEPKNKKKLGAMDLRSVSGVTAGTGVGHKKKLMGKKVDEDCAFSVVGERSALDLETNVKPDVKKWVTALNTLLTIFRENPGAL